MSYIWEHNNTEIQLHWSSLILSAETNKIKIKTYIPVHGLIFHCNLQINKYYDLGMGFKTIPPFPITQKVNEL